MCDGYGTSKCVVDEYLPPCAERSGIEADFRRYAVTRINAVFPDQNVEPSSAFDRRASIIDVVLMITR